MLQKKVFNAALFHTGSFDFCPAGRTHSHTTTITVIAKSGLDSLVLDSIIPCENDNLEAFFILFKDECIKSKVDLVSVELFFLDINMSYVFLY